MNAVRDDCPGSVVAADPLASIRANATAIAYLAFDSFSRGIPIKRQQLACVLQCSRGRRVIERGGS